MSRHRRRRIAVVTGTRAEYGLLRSTMQAVEEHPRLALQVAVAGMHLLKKFGHTIDEIRADGWRIDTRVRMQTGNDDALDQAVGLSRGVAGLARFFDSADADVVVVLGDRIEAMAGALAGVTTGRIVAHIHGGDVAPGDLDEGLRHAITKLAHLHLAATAQAARRIIRMGERPEQVHNVGAPGLDRLIEVVGADRNGRRARQQAALVIQHPSGRSADRERKTMSAILRAVADSGLRPIVIYPNSDRGHTGIIAVIEAATRRAGSPVRVERSLARDDFLHLLADVRLLVGNSSCGIIEAASAGTAAVNVGPRQAGRQRSGPSVVDCSESYDQIRTAITRALRKRPRLGGRTCYGHGRTGHRIAAVLARTRLDDALRRKQIKY
ncbi:MAG: UDP-N-acetylglucosamine 2-epimerase (hydrolyzing) [bacterium]|nr:UDP-N-acetylglucosamine 2-epimerase (hydrolyzing) [bacterium]